MNWNDIRNRYPNRWLLVEAVRARSENSRRMVETWAVVDVFEESHMALQSYLDVHNSEPERELYVAHSSRSALNIEERRWVGLRVPGQ